MNYQELLKSAREKIGPQCRVCRECDGRVCRGEIPGAGGKGTGRSFLRNYEALAALKINMDVIYDSQGQNTELSLFGKEFKAPIFAAPISGMSSNYNGLFTEKSYNQILVQALKDSGCAAFTGDGVSRDFYEEPLEAIKAAGGCGIPTIKPWDQETVLKKLRLAEEAGVMAIAMDIDSAGLPILNLAGRPGQAKSQEQLAQLIASTSRPFLLKGIMTPESARKAKNCGAYGIIVSNHGGRVLDDTPGTVEVLPAIRRAVGTNLKIFLDGAIRSGTDVFKALALGADGVLIGRPYVIAAYGNGEEGIRLYTEKIIGELKDTMKMTGCACLSDIDVSKMYI